MSAARESHAAALFGAPVHNGDTVVVTIAVRRQRRLRLGGGGGGRGGGGGGLGEILLADEAPVGYLVISTTGVEFRELPTTPTALRIKLSPLLPIDAVTDRVRRLHARRRRRA